MVDTDEVTEFMETYVDGVEFVLSSLNKVSDVTRLNATQVSFVVDGNRYALTISHMSPEEG